MAAPTCKVVTKAGERGARIFPKGCKVRSRVTQETRGFVLDDNDDLVEDVDNPVITRVNKQGQQKLTKKTGARQAMIIVTSRYQRALYEDPQFGTFQPLSQAQVMQRRAAMTAGWEKYKYRDDSTASRRRIDWAQTKHQTLVYDTGAMGTSMDVNIMKRMGFVPNGPEVPTAAGSWAREGGLTAFKPMKLPHAYGIGTDTLYYNLQNGNNGGVAASPGCIMEPHRSIGVGGPIVDVVYPSVPLSVLLAYEADGSTTGIWKDIVVDIDMDDPNTLNSLFGIDAIRQLGSLYKIKFGTGVQYPTDNLDAHADMALTFQGPAIPTHAGGPA